MCGAIFTSLERLDYRTALSFENQASHIVPFDRDKLFTSLYEACRHRKSAVEDATALTDTVIGKLLRRSTTTGLVRRADVVTHTYATLKAFDRAAQVYYTAYHPL